MNRRKRGALAGASVGLGMSIFLAPFIGPFALLMPSLASIVGAEAADTEPKPRSNRHDRDNIDEDDPLYHNTINRRSLMLDLIHSDVMRRLEDSLNDTPRHIPLTPYIAPRRENRNNHQVLNQGFIKPCNNFDSGNLQGARGTMENETYFQRHRR